jgi:hypothetical protein
MSTTTAEMQVVFRVRPDPDGLVASVPITTAIAAYVVSGRIRSGRISGGEHAA